MALIRMCKPVLNIGIIPPRQPLSSDIFSRVIGLLARHPETVNVFTIGRAPIALDGQAIGKVHGLPGCDFEEALADLFIAWDMIAAREVLAKTPHQPIIYGVTLDSIIEGVLPVHPGIIAYFSDTIFLQGILTNCGIPLTRQFLLTACMGREYQARMDAMASGGKGILLVSDDAKLIAVVTTVCELLGARLERVSYGLLGQDTPPDFYHRYDCIIAAGPTALRAAAAGVAVIVADERGGAGLLTLERLRQVLDAQGGPACFDTPVGIEFFLSALSDRPALAAARLPKELCDLHCEAARARQWTEWLCQVWENADAKSAPQSDPSLRLLGIATHMRPSTYRSNSLEDITGSEIPPVDIRSCPLPDSEVLVDIVMEPWISSTVPNLPLNRQLKATDTDRETLLEMLGEGWANMESWGCWTNGNEAVLSFKSDVPAGGDLELQLNISTYLPPCRVFQRVAVSVNGHPLLCWKVDRPALFKIPLYVAHGEDPGIYHITFHLPDAESPAIWGGGDARKLGLGLVSLILVPT